MASALTFAGEVTKGAGHHSELFVPGKTLLPNSPPDWPEKLQPGSLNVKIDQGGYPEEFGHFGIKITLKPLDGVRYPAALEIPQEAMGNNLLGPLQDMPDRGRGKVWRARVEADSFNFPALALRRIGSRLPDQLELISDVHLRSNHALTDGLPLIVHLKLGK